MTHDELKALATEAGNVTDFFAYLERFAQLVAEKKDKRIAELEKYGRVQDPLAQRIAELEALLLAQPFKNEREKEAERKLALAREALKNTQNWMLTLTADECPDTAYIPVREALAQIGGDDAS